MTFAAATALGAFLPQRYAFRYPLDCVQGPLTTRQSPTTARQPVALRRGIAYNDCRSTPDARSVPIGAACRDALVAQLDDSDVLSIAALRHDGRAFVSGRTGSFTALAVEELPTEFRGYGDPVALAELMGQVDDWRCLEVETELAHEIARNLRINAHGAVRFYGSVYHELRRPVRRIRHDGIQALHLDHVPLLTGADPELHLDEPERDLGERIVVGAVINGRLVARAACVARSQRYGDIGVATLQPYRGQGLATAAAAEVAHQLQQSQDGAGMEHGRDEQSLPARRRQAPIHSHQTTHLRHPGLRVRGLRRCRGQRSATALTDARAHATTSHHARASRPQQREQGRVVTIVDARWAAHQVLKRRHRAEKDSESRFLFLKLAPAMGGQRRQVRPGPRAGSGERAGARQGVGQGGDTLALPLPSRGHFAHGRLDPPDRVPAAPRTVTACSLPFQAGARVRRRQHLPRQPSRAG